MPVTFKKIDKKDFLEIRNNFLESYKYLSDFDLETAFRFHKSLPDYKNFQKKLEKSIENNKIMTQAYSKETLLEDLIKNLNTFHRVGQADFLSVIIDSHTRENHYDNAKIALEDSIKSNKSLLNGFPLVNYGVKLARKIINDVEVPLQIKHGSPDARLLIEMALLAGFSAFDGGGISHNVPFTKSISLKESLENWRYVDRLVGLYEENGIRINREIFSPLTATLVPPAISNSIQILETLLAVEQGVKNISVGVAQYGNITQDIASLLALKEQVQFYLDTFSFKDINISTVFSEWIGGFPEEELKALSEIDPYLLTLDCELSADDSEIERHIVQEEPHLVRGDSSDYVLRSSQSRITHKKDHFEPHDTRPIEKGDILIDNYLYTKYAGELQVALLPMENSGKTNVVGRILEQDLPLLDLLKPWQKFQFSVKDKK